MTLDLDGSNGTLAVENDSEHDLDPPGLYVEDAVDGHVIDVEVVDSAPVAAGEQASFDVKLDGITVDDIGLLVLLFGAVVNEDAFLYLNRLSDTLFVLARVAAGEAEPISRTEAPG